MNIITCNYCYHWRAHDASFVWGRCQRKSPPWPETECNDSCGQFELKEEQKKTRMLNRFSRNDGADVTYTPGLWKEDDVYATPGSWLVLSRGQELPMIYHSYALAQSITRFGFGPHYKLIKLGEDEPTKP